MKNRGNNSMPIGPDHGRILTAVGRDSARRIGRVERKLVAALTNRSALPALPSDGQTILYQSAAMRTDGVIWQFRYNAASTSAYKWEFIGGPPWFSTMVGTEEGVGTAATWVNLATDGPSITVPLAGDYASNCWAYGVTSGGASTVQIGTAVGNTTPAANRPQTTAAINNYANLSDGQRISAVPAATGIKMRYYGGTITTDKFGNRGMCVTPIRVG